MLFLQENTYLCASFAALRKNIRNDSFESKSMKESIKIKAKEVLTEYTELNKHRKTPERYAILDAVYSMDKHFTLEELGAYLEKKNFRVSRATLYNTMRLFITLRLVVRHRYIGRTVYEACYENGDHCHQVCTICGKVLEVKDPQIEAVINSTKLSRFRKDGFTLYIYGVCTTCQRRLSRLMKTKKKTTEK